MRRGILISGGVALAAVGIASAFVLGRHSLHDRLSTKSSPSFRATSSASERSTAPTVTTAAPTDNPIFAEKMAAPAAACIAYAPGIDDGQGVNRLGGRGALVVKATPGDSVTLVLHLPDGDHTLRDVSNGQGSVVFDIDLRNYRGSGVISPSFTIVADVIAQASNATYHCATSFHADP